MAVVKEIEGKHLNLSEVNDAPLKMWRLSKRDRDFSEFEAQGLIDEINQEDLVSESDEMSVKKEPATLTSELDLF